MNLLQLVPVTGYYADAPFGDFERREAVCPPDTRDLRDRVAAMVGLGTGGQALVNSDADQSAFAGLWAAAAAAGRETAWHRLPDQARDVLEGQSQRASKADFNFIAETMAGGPVEAVAGVRVLACLGEEDLAPMENIRALLLDFLEHQHPAVRVAAAEAFWQLADRSVTGQLQAALQRERHAQVRHTIEHVLHVFG